MTHAVPRRPIAGDAILAIVVACVLGGFWAMQNWGDLTALRLPDTDDAMRLQQVRDWIAGQGWSDLTQYRLGESGGLAMHWSRLIDLPLAGVILILTPLVGVHAAELAAVVAVPLAYFVAALVLTAAVARRLGGEPVARTAMLVAALGYPAISLFMPGRIDHHAAQLVLLLAALHGMIAPPSKTRGVAIGLALFASLAIGLEMLPLIAVVGAWAVLDWLWRCEGADARFAGIGGGLAIGGVLGAGLIPATSPTDLCDAINPALRGVVIAGGFAALLLGTFGGRLRLSRWLVAALAGSAVATLALAVAPQCLAGPYGVVDPMLKRLWLANVAEALPLARTPFAFGLGYAGLMIAGLIATVIQAWRRGGAWWGIVALLAVSLAVTMVQLRGAYAGALLAAPGLAAAIAAARARGILALAGAWIASAGILYPIAGAAVTRPPDNPGLAEARCTGPAQLAALDRLPAGRIVAPIDIGAFAIPATHHASLSAPYHRNNAANAAMYRFFLGPQAEARDIAARYGLAYVGWCAGALGEIDFDKEAAPDALARALTAGRAPAWLRPVKRGGLTLWRIERR